MNRTAHLVALAALPRWPAAAASELPNPSGTFETTVVDVAPVIGGRALPVQRRRGADRRARRHAGGPGHRADRPAARRDRRPPARAWLARASHRDRRPGSRRQPPARTHGDHARARRDAAGDRAAPRASASTISPPSATWPTTASRGPAARIAAARRRDWPPRSRRWPCWTASCARACCCRRSDGTVLTRSLEPGEVAAAGRTRAADGRPHAAEAAESSSRRRPRPRAPRARTSPVAGGRAAGRGLHRPRRLDQRRGGVHAQERADPPRPRAARARREAARSPIPTAACTWACRRRCVLP